MEKTSFQQIYGFYPDEMEAAGSMKKVTHQKEEYWLTKHYSNQHAKHQMMFSYYLMEQGEAVTTFVPSAKGEYFQKTNQGGAVLLKAPHVKKGRFDGAKLAEFHESGMHYPYKKEHLDSVGLWQLFFERRLEKIESDYHQHMMGGAKNEMEERWFRTFPYYLGLTENAIQYVGEIERFAYYEIIDEACICHNVIPESLMNGHDHYFHFSHTFFIDHPMRDLCEWMRMLMEQNQMQEAFHFLEEYQSVQPLSSVSLRLLFGRLLYPRTYLECIERYTNASSSQEKEHVTQQFDGLVSHAESYEYALRTFFTQAGINRKQHSIPQIDWLQKPINPSI